MLSYSILIGDWSRQPKERNAYHWVTVLPIESAAVCKH
jgi:hypothetical protein